MKINTYGIYLIASYIAHTHTQPNYHQSQASELFLPWAQGSVFGSISMQVGGLLILSTGLAHHTLMQHALPLRTLYEPLFPSFDTPDIFWITESNLSCVQNYIWNIVAVYNCSLYCFLPLQKGHKVCYSRCCDFIQSQSDSEISNVKFHIPCRVFQRGILFLLVLGFTQLGLCSKLSQPK